MQKTTCAILGILLALALAANAEAGLLRFSYKQAKRTPAACRQVGSAAYNATATSGEAFGTAIIATGKALKRVLW